MTWERVEDGVWLYRDACLVYAVEGPRGVVVINAGTGRWLKHRDALPGPVRAVLCTHFFRDHTAGAAPAARAGIPVWAPYWEQEQFADPHGLFQRRETYLEYHNIWDFFAPVEPIPVSRWLLDDDTVSIAGLTVRVLPNPGVTVGAVTFLVERGARRLAFCGELIHSPGKLARIAPLQYDYNDLRGAVNVISAIEWLRAERPDALFPSLGQPLRRDADAALTALDASLRRALAGRPELMGELEKFSRDPLTRVTDHIWCSTFGGGGACWLLLSRSGKALAIDYGSLVVRLQGCSLPQPRHRRVLLHTLAALQKRFGIAGIDVVVATHYHEDHIAGIPLLQRRYGTRCWAGENFASLLADPAAHHAPCTWPEPIRVEPQPLGVPVPWEEYVLRFEPLSGHTHWSTLVLFEADGLRVAATGDQYFWHHFGFAGETGLLEYDGSPAYANWVYRNGARLESFHDSARRLAAWCPDIVLPGHGCAYRTNALWYEALQRHADDYAAIHTRLMPLGPDDTHFEVDSRAAWLTPYRVHRTAPADGAPLAFRTRARNPFPHPATLAVRLVGPPEWVGAVTTARADGRAEVDLDVTIAPPVGAVCRRTPVALELCAGDQSFGQVAEALVTLGCERF